MDLEKVIQGCKKGKRKYQKALYNQYAPILLGICFRYIPKEDAANDVLQEAFIKIFGKISAYRGDGSFEGWMKRITVNCALDEINRQKKNKLDYNEVEYVIAVNDFDDKEDVLKMIAMLPEEYREVFNLHAIEGYSFKEMSEMLNLSEVNVRVRYHRSKKKLQELIAIYF